MPAGDEEDVVVLVFTESSDVAAMEEENDAAGEDEDQGEMTLSTSEVGNWDLPRILRSPAVKVHASRSRLVEGSSYFRSLLGGSFSESVSGQVCIRCNLRTAVSVLQCICGHPLNIEPENFLVLLEGSLFFGVDSLLSECKAWLQQITSVWGTHSLKISVDTMTEIWKYSSEHGISFASEICAAYLARNFVWTITCTSFVDLPYDLLCSCLEHPDLTVYSEEQLCEALLHWIESNRKISECSCDFEEDYISILEKVRAFLLPLGYSAGRGKKKSRWFSSIAQVSIDGILDLTKEWPSKLLALIKDDNSDNLRVRLTQYSEKIDLSGCVHFTADLLYLAVLPNDMEAVSRKRILQTLVECDQRGGNIHCFLEKLPTTLSFETVLEVDMSKCPKLHFHAVISLLHSSFPSLQVLKLSYCSHVKMEDLFSLVRNCPSLVNIDLTVDISPVIPTHASLSSASSEQYQTFSGAPYASLQHLPMVSNITKLTLEGRIDLNDLDLSNICAISGSLCCLNLKGCMALTDVGISKLLQKCICLQSITVSYTSFGMNSVLMLCYEKEFPNASLRSYQNYDHSNTTAFSLKELQMDGCKGVEARHMKQLLRCLFMLKSLSLCKTSLADDALSEYRGSLLERLDVSETLVSFRALCHVIKRNPDLRMLRVSGCWNFYNTEGVASTSTSEGSSEDLFRELNEKCLLEEVAFGWGFTSSSLFKGKNAFARVRTMSIGLGASLDISLLPEICPLIDTLVLKFQVISDSDLRSILKSLRHLHVLDICCCLCDLTSGSFQLSMKTLKSLRLERATPWMTNDDLITLSANCLNLRELSLSGCRLLNSDAQQIISSGWPGLTVLHLEDCGSITSAGVCSLLDCVAIEDLLLCHNGRGVKRNIISYAASKLPLLRKIALDMCDACEGGFDSPSHSERSFVSIVRIARCRSQRCGFDVGRWRPVRRDTIVQVWSSRQLWTACVEERV